jgi:short-subunit dehydrogenase
MTAEGWAIIIGAVGVCAVSIIGALALAAVQVMNARRQDVKLEAIAKDAEKKNEKLEAIATDAAKRDEKVDKIADDSEKIHVLVNSQKSAMEEMLKEALTKIAGLQKHIADLSGLDKNNLVAKQAQADADAGRPAEGGTA